MNAVYLLVTNPTPRLENIPAQKNPPESASDEERTDPSEYQGKKVWNSDMETDLIRLIKEEENLWNVKSDLFKDRFKKWRAVDRVIGQMKNLWPAQKNIMTYSNCLSKFKNLRTYYQKQRRKMQRRQSENKLFKSQWIHYNALTFLDSVYNVKEEKEEDVSYSPIIIQFPQDLDSPLDTIENIDISEIVEETTENEISHEDQNGMASCTDTQTSFSREKIPPKSKTKVLKRQAETTNGFGKAQKLHKFQPSSKLKVTPTKKSKQSVARVVPVGSNFFKKEQKIEMSHDEAFGNFIAKDLAQIPEGKQKEQLRFQIVEMIHRCKMDGNLIFE